MKMTGLLMSAVAVGFVSNAALGSISVNQVEDPNVPAGYVANEIVWNGPADWTSANLWINLPTGSTYQDTFGANGPYTPALLVPFPSVEFDTYVGILEYDAADDPIGNGITGGGNDTGEYIPLSLDAPQISINWYDTRTEDYGPVRIGMMTLSEDAMGDWRLSSAGVLYGGGVVNGVMMPEPASLGLLSLGGLALLRRR